MNENVTPKRRKGIVLSVIDIVLIALALSADAFAVSVSLGLSESNIKPKHALLPGLYFGIFQAVMPVIGYFAGKLFADSVEQYDHWVAFALLVFLGLKTVAGALREKDEKQEEKTENPFKHSKLLVFALATSIDALAVGITFAVAGTNILEPAIVIGVITCVLSMIGVYIGAAFGSKFKKKAEIAGGIMLILMGIRFLIEGLVG